MNAADIATRIRGDILKGVYQRADRLPSERKLAAELGVARNTLREALLRLERDAYVDIKPGSGTYVTYRGAESTAPAIANANPLELIDARFALEPHICRLCVLYGSRAHFDSLYALCDQMEAAAGDPVTFAEVDADFHRTLAASTQNGLLTWVIGQINTVRTQDEWQRMRSLTLNREIIDLYNVQHRALVDAIRAREPEQAAALMKEHLETARLSLTRVSET